MSKPSAVNVRVHANPDTITLHRSNVHPEIVFNSGEPGAGASTRWPGGHASLDASAVSFSTYGNGMIETIRFWRTLAAKAAQAADDLLLAVTTQDEGSAR